jgi:hypothetical protein
LNIYIYIDKLRNASDCYVQRYAAVISGRGSIAAAATAATTAASPAPGVAAATSDCRGHYNERDEGHQ